LKDIEEDVRGHGAIGDQGIAKSQSTLGALDDVSSELLCAEEPSVQHEVAEAFIALV
jgi:hypothetical protein